MFCYMMDKGHIKMSQATHVLSDHKINQTIKHISLLKAI